MSRIAFWVAPLQREVPPAKFCSSKGFAIHSPLQASLRIVCDLPALDILEDREAA
ncbi:MAG: hypothetical protein R6V44_03320 [Paracoccaceae bacterium]